MSEYIPELLPVSTVKREGKIKKVTLDLSRGDIMHVTFMVGKKMVLRIEAIPGNMSIEREIDGAYRREINFHTKVLRNETD